jgi:hypothetical protein
MRAHNESVYSEGGNSVTMKKARIARVPKPKAVEIRDLDEIEGNIGRRGNYTNKPGNHADISSYAYNEENNIKEGSGKVEVIAADYPKEEVKEINDTYGSNYNENKPGKQKRMKDELKELFDSTTMDENKDEYKYIYRFNLDKLLNVTPDSYLVDQQDINGNYEDEGDGKENNKKGGRKSKFPRNNENNNENVKDNDDEDNDDIQQDIDEKDLEKDNLNISVTPPHQMTVKRNSMSNLNEKEVQTVNPEISFIKKEVTHPIKGEIGIQTENAEDENEHRIKILKYEEEKEVQTDDFNNALYNLKNKEQPRLLKNNDNEKEVQTDDFEFKRISDKLLKRNDLILVNNEKEVQTEYSEINYMNPQKISEKPQILKINDKEIQTDDSGLNITPIRKITKTPEHILKNDVGEDLSKSGINSLLTTKGETDLAWRQNNFNKDNDYPNNMNKGSYVNTPIPHYIDYTKIDNNNNEIPDQHLESYKQPFDNSPYFNTKYNNNNDSRPLELEAFNANVNDISNDEKYSLIKKYSNNKSGVHETYPDNNGDEYNSGYSRYKNQLKEQGNISNDNKYSYEISPIIKPGYENNKYNYYEISPNINKPTNVNNNKENSTKYDKEYEIRLQPVEYTSPQNVCIIEEDTLGNKKKRYLGFDKVNAGEGDLKISNQSLLEKYNKYKSKLHPDTNFKEGSNSNGFRSITPILTRGSQDSNNKHSFRKENKFNNKLNNSNISIRDRSHDSTGTRSPLSPQELDKWVRIINKYKDRFLSWKDIKLNTLKVIHETIFTKSTVPSKN